MSRKAKGIILGIILIVGVAAALFYVYAAVLNEGSDFEICLISGAPSCCSGGPTVEIAWTFSSSQSSYSSLPPSTQNSYSIELATSTTGTPIYSEYMTHGPSTRGVTVTSAMTTTGLSYSTTYYVRLKVKDSYGSISNWTPWMAIASCAPCNGPPTISNPQKTAENVCSDPNYITLSWEYNDPDGDNASQYRIIVDQTPLSSPYVIDETHNVNWSSGTTHSRSFIVSNSGPLYYDTNYDWQVKVWDEHGEESTWASSFCPVTAVHRGPSPDFSWAPEEPNVNEPIQFTDESVAYGGATIVGWAWDFDPDGNPSTSSSQNPVASFPSVGSKTISLAVTDSDGITCSISKTLNMCASGNCALPDWKEISPF